jgi:DNA-binding CsgD family transcriptional regulator/GAF domain-containing protein
MDQDQVLAFIERLYEAPGAAASWQQLATRFVHVFGAEHAHLVVFDQPGRVHCDFITSNEAGDAYARHYGALDTAVHRVMRGADRKAATQLDVMSADELKVCPMQQEMMPDFGVEHRLWVKTRLSSGLTYFTAAIRTARQGAFTARDYRLLETLHPHVERAMRLHLELAQARAQAQSVEAGLDALAGGLVLLDTKGTVMFANRAARALLDARDGLTLERGRLMATMSSAQARLQAILAQALGTNGPMLGGGIAVERVEGRPLIVRVLPIAPVIDLLAPRAAAVVLIHDPERAAPADSGWRSALGLTPAEGRLVAALAAGQSLEAYAQEAGLRLHTVRSVLKTIFAKTDTHRQSELVALVLRSSAG